MEPLQIDIINISGSANSSAIDLRKYTEIPSGAVVSEYQESAADHE